MIIFRAEEKLRMNFNKEIDELKRKHEQMMEKQEEKMKSELQQIDKFSVEKKLAHENEKQKVISLCFDNNRRHLIF